ncbi:hypothetical protein CANCADRAFT_29692 [Tortispora caseinolytica NRRL Y-17796]|uniref:Uncharacterized protein n=1 Tax=Tortispora caseinolytica NRRL Y-17796 TaxID=767744 RepID=A0A1E4T9E3_9ASCO|nr:hypothetical protein CANCADRAFT_29692 [Tortispora caseinolytica NRRL Y-17796]
MIVLFLVVECGLMFAVSANFQTLHQAYPYAVTALVSSILAAISQLLNQLLFVHKFMPARTLKFHTWGTVNGIINKYWYDLITPLFPSIPLRVIIDQCIGTPVFNVLFLSFSALWENHNIPYTVRTKLRTTLTSAYIIWPLFSFVSFQFIPQHLIVPAAGIVGILWTLILSKITES